ncbi:hypothetical protein GINT2_000478 [Glugoides intestinalis]
MQAETENRISLQRASFFHNLNAISCIRILVTLDIMFQVFKIIFSSVVLYLTTGDALEEPLRAFLLGYMFLCAAKAITFFSKNRTFFNIDRIPEFEENNDISVLGNLVEGCNLFWYVLGFHWIQQCEKCSDMHPLLYYTSLAWLILGFIAFIAPFVAIVLLLVLMTYVKPKLKTITYQGESDISDDNTRCIICYESYRPGCKVKFLPCNHHFHSECIDEWFHVRDSCPLCKKSTNILYDLIESNPV